MTVLNFPADTSQSPYEENGIIYVWDGQAWITDGSNDAGLWELNGNTIKTSNDSHNVSIGGGDITLNASGSAEFAGDVQAYGNPNNGTARGTRLSRGSLQACQTTGVSATYEGYLQGTSLPTSQILADGSATFGPNSAGKVVMQGMGTTQGELVISNPTGSNSFNCFRVVGQGVNNVVFTQGGSATFAGDITAGNVSFNLEPDNDAYYTVTTDVDEDGNETETRVYNGPTLDVKERVMNLISRLDAIEANEVIDDATDTSLIQLVANASARLDSIEARIAQIEVTVTSLQGGTN